MYHLSKSGVGALAAAYAIGTFAGAIPGGVTRRATTRASPCSAASSA